MTAQISLFDILPETVATAVPATPVVEFDAVTYVDPFPGRKGDERVKETCPFCTNGVYGGYSSYTWLIEGKGEDKWCFRCDGRGYNMIKVSSVRARARRVVKETNAARRAAAEFELNRPILEWLEAEKAYNEAQAAEAAEAARVAALVQGYVAEIGEKIKDLPATVTYAGVFEVDSFRGYGTEQMAMVILTAEDGKVLKAAGTGRTLYGLEKGDTVTVSGTVKDHGEYKGQQQTVLTRAKITK